MNTIKMLRNLATRFPKSICSRGDHVGLMTGKLKEETKSILLCLDFDKTVLNYVKKMSTKPDLILSHHPFIYGTKYRIFKRDLVKKEVCDEIDALNIPVYSMHTNFDTGKGGMNDALAEALNLSDIKPLEFCRMARGGKLPKKMEIHEFAKYVNECLNLPYSHLINAGKKNIETVAILGGGGSFAYTAAMKEDYDILISGDVPHHARRDIISYGYNFLDCSHEIERIFMKQMKKILLGLDPNLEITIVDHEEIPELIK